MTNSLENLSKANVDSPAALTRRSQALWPRNRRLAFIVAVLLWTVPMLVIAVLVIHNPLRHTVTMGSYHLAAENWWSARSLYVGPSGMNYLPHFAVLYSPFHFLPLTVSEIVWRFCAAVTLAGGLWLLTRELFGMESERPFLWASILAMPLCMGALRNGNANAIFGGVTLLAVVATLQKRWWLAVGWMVLATALKPLGFVLLLLASIYYAPITRRLPAALLGLAIFPFFFGSPDYVLAQYRDAWHNLRDCAAVSEHRFADLNGILRTFGAPLSAGPSTIVRVLAGGVTAMAWLWGAQRLSPALRCLWLYALATAYLMLFNPMTEANSYVILAPALGVWGAWFLCSDELGGQRLGWCIAVMALCMGLLPNIMRPLFGNYFALFWHPLMTILFVAALIHFISRADVEKLCLQPANQS
jgi:alpha-1,2-mannosyltransferase